jgi:hypothetical protein
MTKPSDPLAPIEAAQKVIAAADATLAQLEAARLDLTRVIADAEAEREQLAARRKIEMTAATPVGELDKKLEALDRREKEASRRSEIALAILGQLEPRIADKREEEIEAKRREAYAAARNLRDETAKRVKTFLNKAVPEAQALLQAYIESEAVVTAVNRNLPAAAAPIPSIEQERLGGPTPPRITERRFQGLVHQGQLVGELGKVEAFPHQGHWVVYKRSNAVQGDLTIGPCALVDYIESTVEKYEAPRLEALASALRVPAFDAPAPKLGRPERRVTPAAQAPLQMAAE